MKQHNKMKWKSIQLMGGGTFDSSKMAEMMGYGSQLVILK